MSLPVSILITYHNEGSKLTKCINSILHQLPEVAQIIVFDDASVVPASEWAPADKRITINRSEQNVGPSQGRNMLARLATSEYIHFHDSDDWFEPRWASEIAKAVKLDPDVIYTDIRSRSPVGTVVADSLIPIEALSKSDVPASIALRHSLLTPSTTLKRSFFLKIGGYAVDCHQSEDYEFNIRLLLARPRLVCLPESLVCIQLHGTDGSNRSQDRRAVFRDAIKVCAKVGKMEPSLRAIAREMVAYFAAQLFRNNDKVGAREGFRVAASLGQVRFLEFPPKYRACARVIGPNFTEFTAKLYRRLLPEFVRRRIASI